ncbi:ATP-dependent DNA helicase MER3 [Sparganum proliferum]
MVMFKVVSKIWLNKILRYSTRTIPPGVSPSTSVPPPTPKTNTDRTPEPPLPSSSSSIASTSAATAPAPTATASNPNTPTNINLTTATTSDVDSVHNCPHGDRTFTSRVDLVCHFQIHRTEAGEPVPGAPTYTRRIRIYCPLCPSTFTHRVGLFSHTPQPTRRRSACSPSPAAPPPTPSLEPDSTDLSCLDCSRAFTSHIGLVVHLRIRRAEAGEPVPGAPTYIRRIRLNCLHCAGTFTHRMGLLSQMRIHENLRQTTAGYTTPSHLPPPAPHNIVTHHRHPGVTSHGNIPNISNEEVLAASLLITTPEKVDVIFRTQPELRPIFSDLQLVLVDELSGHEKMNDLISFVAKCREFGDITLRQQEKYLLNRLNKASGLQKLRYPVSGSVSSPDAKISILLQAQLNDHVILDSTLQADAHKVMICFVRTMIGLRSIIFLEEGQNQRDARRSDEISLSDEFEERMKKNGFSCLIDIVELCKAALYKLWPDHPLASIRQLPGIGKDLADRLFSAGITSIIAIEKSGPRKIEEVLSRVQPFGDNIYEAALKIPKYELAVEQNPLYASTDDKVPVKSNIDLITPRAVLYDPPHSCDAKIDSVMSVDHSRQPPKRFKWDPRRVKHSTPSARPRGTLLGGPTSEHLEKAVLNRTFGALLSSTPRLSSDGVERQQPLQTPLNSCHSMDDLSRLEHSISDPNRSPGLVLDLSPILPVDQSVNTEEHAEFPATEKSQLCRQVSARTTCINLTDMHSERQLTRSFAEPLPVKNFKEPDLNMLPSSDRPMRNHNCSDLGTVKADIYHSPTLLKSQDSHCPRGSATAHFSADMRPDENRRHSPIVSCQKLADNSVSSNSPLRPPTVDLDTFPIVGSSHLLTNTPTDQGTFSKKVSFGSLCQLRAATLNKKTSKTIATDVGYGGEPTASLHPTAPCSASTLEIEEQKPEAGLNEATRKLAVSKSTDSDCLGKNQLTSRDFDLICSGWEELDTFICCYNILKEFSSDGSPFVTISAPKTPPPTPVDDNCVHGPSYPSVDVASTHVPCLPTGKFGRKEESQGMEMVHEVEE